MSGALFEDPDTTFGLPLLTVQVCWNCEYLQGKMGMYSSKGPKCGECGEYLETYKIQES
jgi:hypothetical protein